MSNFELTPDERVQPKAQLVIDQYGNFRVNIESPQSCSPSEIAHKALAAVLEPIQELERTKVLINPSIYLYGGAVWKPLPPRDLDILVVYERLNDFHVDRLSPKARHVISYMPNINMYPISGAASYLCYIAHSAEQGQLPEMAFDVSIESRVHVETLLQETPQKSELAALYALSHLGNSIYWGKGSDSEYGEGVTFTAILARHLNKIPFSKNQLAEIARFTTQDWNGISEMMSRGPEQLTQEESGYLLDRAHECFNRQIEDQGILERLSNLPAAGTLESRELLKDLVLYYSQHLTPLHAKHLARRFENFTHKSNIFKELRDTHTGVLLNSRPLVVNGVELFSK